MVYNSINVLLIYTIQIDNILMYSLVIIQSDMNILRKTFHRNVLLLCCCDCIAWTYTSSHLFRVIIIAWGFSGVKNAFNFVNAQLLFKMRWFISSVSVYSLATKFQYWRVIQPHPFINCYICFNLFSSPAGYVLPCCGKTAIGTIIQLHLVRPF